MASNVEEDVVLEQRGSLLLARLNRPKLGNALRHETFLQLIEALRKAADTEEVKVFVLVGEGKFFTTGADVEAAKIDADLQSTLRLGPIRLTQALIDFPKVAVAAVNGPVVGYPAALLGLFDLVFVSPTATFTINFMHLGLVPEADSSVTLQQILGPARLWDLLLTGRKLSAPEMVEWGLASRVLPEDKFLDTVLGILDAGALKSSAQSLKHAKRLIRAPLRQAMTANNEAEASALISQFEVGEPLERFAALLKELKAKRQKAKL